MHATGCDSGGREGVLTRKAGALEQGAVIARRCDRAWHSRGMKAGLFAIMLAACGGSQQPPPPPVSNSVPAPPVDAAVDAAPTGSAAMLAKMTQFTDEICTCSDRACADHVSEQISQWGQEMAKSYDRDAKPTEDDVKRMTSIAQRMTTCMTRIYTQGSGSGSAP